MKKLVSSILVGVALLIGITSAHDESGKSNMNHSGMTIHGGMMDGKSMMMGGGMMGMMMDPEIKMMLMKEMMECRKKAMQKIMSNPKVMEKMMKKMMIHKETMKKVLKNNPEIKKELESIIKEN